VSRLIEAHASEETPLRLTACDLRTHCRAAADRGQSAATGKQQRIVLTLPEQAAVGRADAIALDRVVENLLGNALKFSPAGATVEIVVIGRGKGGWRIEVRDEGPGVPAEEEPRLWQKFHRGSARPTGGESSTGLGLFIVKTLADAMGG